MDHRSAGATAGVQRGGRLGLWSRQERDHYRSLARDVFDRDYRLFERPTQQELDLFDSF
jgi:hypothetical protein